MSGEWRREKASGKAPCPECGREVAVRFGWIVYHRAPGQRYPDRCAGTSKPATGGVSGGGAR